jgi:predicted peptidase
LAAGAIVSAGTAVVQADGLPGRPSSERLTLHPAGSVEGAPAGYVEYLPPGYGDGEPRPLIVYLHSLGGNGDGSEAALDLVTREGVPALIDDDAWPEDRPFVVLAPQNDAVDDCPTVDDIESFLSFATDHYEIDEARVYLTGISCGAVGAWDYLAAHPGEVVAAAVLLSAPVVFAFERAGCELGRVPTWSFHGDADDIVPIDAVEDPIDEINACTDPQPIDTRLTVYPGVGHDPDAWNPTYELSAGHDIYEWLLDHENQPSAP